MISPQLLPVVSYRPLSDDDLGLTTIYRMATVDKKQLQTFAEEYFSSQNYLNKRILDDVSKVRSNYEENIWSKMNVGEREKVIALINLQVLHSNTMNSEYEYIYN